MSFSQFISILRARWWVVVLVLGVTVATTVIVSLLLPKQYVASASVVVDFKPDPVSSAVFGGMLPPAVMATQVDILNSERVALRVVRNLKLNESAQIRQQWRDDTGGQGTVEQWLVAAFQKNLDVQPSRDSTVITVNYKAPDPRFAAALANAFVQAYLQTAVELRVNPARNFSNFFDQQVKDQREELEKAQAKLSSFQKANGIIASDERLDVETSRLNELSSQLVALQAVTAESRSREAQASTGAGDRLQEVLSNPLISGIRSDISRGEAQLQVLNARLGEKNPQVVEAKANLAALRSRLETETRRVTGGVGVANNINAQRESQLRTALNAQREQVLRMKAVRDQGQLLQRDVENAQRAYDAIQGRLTQTSLESQTTQGNVNPLTQASAPVDPSSPKILLNTALSIFLGLLIAVGVALLLEMRDRRVRSLDDVMIALDLPVLGVMPKPNAKMRGSQRISTMQQRLMAPLPPTAKGA